MKKVELELKGNAQKIFKLKPISRVQLKAHHKKKQSTLHTPFRVPHLPPIPNRSPFPQIDGLNAGLEPMLPHWEVPYR